MVDELLIYLGTFFFFMVLLQRATVLCWVKPSYRLYLELKSRDIRDLEKHTELPELYRATKALKQ